MLRTGTGLANLWIMPLYLHGYESRFSSMQRPFHHKQSADCRLSCLGFAKLPSEFEYLVFQNETLRNSKTHQALSGQNVRTNRTESRGFSMHRGRTEQIHHHRKSHRCD